MRLQLPFFGGVKKARDKEELISIQVRIIAQEEDIGGIK